MTRLHYVLAATLAVMEIVVPAVILVTPKLIWNASASTPVGFYSLRPTHRLHVGDLVAVMPPEPLADFMVARGYIGRHVPLLKHVAALPGQEVCRLDRTVTVDGKRLGEALDRDTHGRDLPVWQGCERLASGSLFLMNPAVPDSLDGRYFGPVPACTVLGQATPLYTDEDGNGHFVWRASAR